MKYLYWWLESWHHGHAGRRALELLWVILLIAWALARIL